MVRRLTCSSIFLQLVILLQLGSILNASDSGELVHCAYRSMTRVRLPSKQTLYTWPEECQVFHGNLLLRLFDLTCANFTNLEGIEGQLSVISTTLESLPQMPNLKKINAHGKPGVLLLNNVNLRDLRGLVTYQKNVEVKQSRMPTFISGNPNLDTVIYPKMFHKPYSPLSCEKRLTPNYNITFAEGQSLTMVLVSLVLVVTVFLYPLGMGSGNVYFVPGYHKL